MTVSLRFQSSGAIPGRGDPVRMRGRSLTIGRGPENDLVLPDPDRLISKRHCVLEDHGGRIVVLDLSSNGTFLNYGKVPLGQVPTTLNDGDVLSLGSYELVVMISDVDLPDPLEIPPLSDGPDLLPPVGEPPAIPTRAAVDLDALLSDGGDRDFLDDLLGDMAPSGPSRVQRPDLADDGLLAPFDTPSDPFADLGPSRADHSDPVRDAFQPPKPQSVIPDDWDLDDLAPPKSDPFIEPPPPPPAPPPPPPRPEIPPVEIAVPISQDAARAFLQALGAGDVSVSDQDLVPTMQRLGTAMATMVQGLREVLMTRTAIKSEFRIEQTRISSRGNNPLKFSVSPEQAIEAMVRPSARGYLDAPTAAAQALDDIKAHEMAMMTGMEAAMKGILARLDPGVLEGQIEVSGGLGSLLKGRKARYWEVYEKMYAEISNQAESDFQELFSKEFARAYQRQLDDLKQKRPKARTDGTEGGAADVLG